MAKKSKEDPAQISLALQGGANITQLKTDLDADRKLYMKNKDMIAELNADNQAIRKRVVARGIPAKAFTRQMERAAMDPDKREQYDLGYEIAGEAFGHPLQTFDEAAKNTDDNPRSNPDAGGAKPQTDSRPLAGLAAAIEQEEGFDPSAVPGHKLN